MGKFLKGLNKTDEALKCFQHVASIDPDNPEVLEETGLLHLQSERTEEGLKWLRRAAESGS